MTGKVRRSCTVRSTPKAVCALVALLLTVLLSAVDKAQANLLAESRKATLAGTDGSTVRKTVVSSKVRLTFLVGLEGTGHHYMAGSFAHMFAENSQLRSETTPCIGTFPYFTKESMSNTPDHYARGIENARMEMRKLADQANSVHLPGTMLGLCKVESYPSGNGRNKVEHYVDVRLLAEIAEEEGVDLRLIYLRRSAEDIFTANTIHRHFQKSLHGDGDDSDATDEQQYMEYTLIMFTEIAVVHSFLSEIEPAFVVCHDYAFVGDHAQAAEVARFVAPNSEVARMFEASLVNMSAPHVAADEAPQSIQDADVAVARLQRKLDAFESKYCTRQP